MRTNISTPFSSIRACATVLAFALALPAPSAGAEPAIEVQVDAIVVEAEHFDRQTLDEARRWYVVSAGESPNVTPDGDPPHREDASGGAYVEILPDTRRTHDDPLVHGENFSNQPGRLAVLHYRVAFEMPGRYYVWVRAFSTGTEDNGIHVGLDGDWPESGQRMQWCEGKQSWRWESRQRTREQHCGVPGQIWLDVETAGVHEVLFSMREDGFEFDAFALTRDPGVFSGSP